MRVTEITIPITDAISSPIGRDEYISNDITYFAKSSIETRINNLELKKYISPDKTDMYYGLIDSAKSELVGILKLEKNKNFWQVRLIQIEDNYKSQGYGTFLYDYCVMNDKITLLADVSQTEGNLGGSRGLWEKLYRQGRFTVCGYDLDTNKVITLDGTSEISSKIYNQKENIVWMAAPKKNQETINEMLTRINNKNKHRTIEWYGSHIIDY